MIPSIEDIIAGLLSGEYTKEQCTAWLYQHIALSEEEYERRRIRDKFAATALQGWLSSYGPEEKHPCEAGSAKKQAQLAYALADAMLSERAE